jgi:hypothetical protein
MRYNRLLLLSRNERDNLAHHPREIRFRIVMLCWILSMMLYVPFGLALDCDRITSLSLTNNCPLRWKSFATFSVTRNNLRSNQHKYHPIFSLHRGGNQDLVSETIKATADSAIGEVIDYGHLVDDAYAWCCSLGTPAALVAGAVVASIYENMNNPDSDYQPENGDTKLVGFAKKMVRSLLITAFACEAMSIFVTTVTGTMLFSQDVDTMLHQGIVRTARTPLQFLHDHFELEYLTGHVTFIQGLLNWFLAIGLSHAIPSTGQKSATPMNQFLAIILLTTTIFMLSIYNKHIYFYENYGMMLHRWFELTFRQFTLWPPTPLTFLLFPLLLLSIFMGLNVFLTQDVTKKDK